MANSVVTVTVTKAFKSDGPFYDVIGTLAVEASPGEYATGGITLNLAKAEIHARKTPPYMNIRGRNGYDYVYIPGTNITDGKLKINTTAAAELAAAATPAGVSGDVIQFHARFLGMI